MHACNNKLVQVEAMDLKENKEGFVGRFGGRKEKEEMMQLYHNLKNKKI